MICPNCDRQIKDGLNYCANCGNYVQTELTPINLNQPQKDSNKENKPKMIFNIIFAVWLMITYCSSATSCFGIFSSESIYEFFLYLFPICISGFVIATGILLINRHKLGFIFQYIVNTIGLLGNILVFALAIFIIFLFDGSASELDMVINVIIDIFAWIFAVLALPNIGMHIAGLIYYTKNKEKYFQTY